MTPVVRREDDSETLPTWMTSNIYSLTDLEARNPKSGCPHGRASSERSREESFLGALLTSGGFRQSLAFFGLWAHHPSLCLHHHVNFFLCVCVSVSESPSAFLYKDPRHWIRANPTSGRTSPYLVYICRDPISK